MDRSRFDHFTRALTAAPSRRAVLRGLVATVFGLAPEIPPGAVHARKRKSNVQLNAFGCVDVGGKCRGQDGVCCSGVCQGKKPKKGKRDKSRCVAHNVGGCTLARYVCLVGVPLAFCSATAVCSITTGNAPFCADEEGGSLEANCQPCRRDTDCEALGFGAGAACVFLRTEGLCEPTCEGVNGSSGTACFPPGR